MKEDGKEYVNEDEEKRERSGDKRVIKCLSESVIK